MSASDEWSPTDAAPIGGAYGDAYSPARRTRRRAPTSLLERTRRAARRLPRSAECASQRRHEAVEAPIERRAAPTVRRSDAEAVDRRDRRRVGEGHLRRQPVLLLDEPRSTRLRCVVARDAARELGAVDERPGGRCLRGAASVRSAQRCEEPRRTWAKACDPCNNEIDDDRRQNREVCARSSSDEIASWLTATLPRRPAPSAHAKWLL